LHCASLSVAGSVLPSAETIENIRYWARKTGTPWIGEHLSFISAPSVLSDMYADEYAAGQPYNIGYTMPPPLNQTELDTVVASINGLRNAFDIPIILENPPIYFPIPGSEMDQVTFINLLVEQTGVGLLLDLAHFFITSQNEGFDPLEMVTALPLEQVVEVHISGVNAQNGIHWDHHADRAPEMVYRMLEVVLRRARPRAITLEFNWNSKFPEKVLLEELRNTRSIVQSIPHGVK
jgi:uncharacterized protein (UPF0276 family)